MGGAVKGEMIPSDVLSASEPLSVLPVLMDSGSLGPSGASFRTTTLSEIILIIPPAVILQLFIYKMKLTYYEMIKKPGFVL